MTDTVDSQSGVGGNQEWKVTAGPRQIRRALDRGSVPQGVVLMDKNEVARVMHQMRDNWKPKKEMRSVKYGTLMLGALAAFNGGIFTTHFRQCMVLRHRARMASYAPTLVIPLITTTMIQDYIFFNRLVGEKPQCQLCSDINVISAQVVVGVIEPYILSVLAAAAVAKLTRVYPLPPLTDVAGMYRSMRALSQRLGTPALVAVVATIVNAAIISHSMGKGAVRLHERLAERTVYLN